MKSREDKEIQARIQSLVRAYRLAGERIERLLRDAVLTDFQRFRYTEQAAQIKAVVRGLDKLAKEAAQGLVPLSYARGANLAADALRDQGTKVRAFNLGNRVHSAAVGVVTEQMTQDLLAGNLSLERQALRLLRKTQQTALDERQIHETIAQGLVEGETRRDVSRRLTNQLLEKLEEQNAARVRVVGRDGRERHFAPDYYAELVARTQTREAVTEGSLRLGQEYEMTLFQVSVHEGACDACLPYQGRIYSTVRGSDFPLLDEHPPYHPNCAHVLTPVDEGTLKRRGEYDAMAAFSQARGVQVKDGHELDRLLAKNRS